MSWHEAACSAVRDRELLTTDRPRKDTRLAKGTGPAELNAAEGPRPWRGAGAMKADGAPSTKDQVQYVSSIPLRDLDSAAFAFRSLRNGISPAAVGTAVCCAPPDRLWTQVYFHGIFSALSVVAHLGEGAVPLPDVLVARLITRATGAAARDGTQGSWNLHGLDWLKNSFPDRVLDSHWLGFMLRAWTDEEWVLAFLRHDPASFRSTLKPVVLTFRHKERAMPRAAVVMLPLPVAADLALLYSELGRNVDFRAPPPPPTGIEQEDRASAAKQEGKAMMRQWAAFGESVPSFPLLFTCLHHVDEPGWDKLEAQLAWLRYTGADWPPEFEVRRRAYSLGIPLPSINRHWGAVVGAAGPSFTLGFAVPRRLAIQIGQWYMPAGYTEKRLLDQDCAASVDLEGKRCPLIPYLLAHAEVDYEGASRVLLSVLCKADPRHACGPWVQAPSPEHRLIPPAVRKAGPVDKRLGRSSGWRRPASSSDSTPATKRRQPSAASTGPRGWRPSVSQD